MIRVLVGILGHLVGIFHRVVGKNERLVGILVPSILRYLVKRRYANEDLYRRLGW